MSSGGKVPQGVIWWKDWIGQWSRKHAAVMAAERVWRQVEKTLPSFPFWPWKQRGSAEDPESGASFFLRTLFKYGTLLQRDLHKLTVRITVSMATYYSSLSIRRSWSCARNTENLNHSRSMVVGAWITKRQCPRLKMPIQRIAKTETFFEIVLWLRIMLALKRARLHCHDRVAATWRSSKFG